MQKWKHWILSDASTESLHRHLDDLGKDGWELVSVATNVVDDAVNGGKGILFYAFLKKPA